MSSNISNASSASTATFVTALVFNAAVFAIQIGIFTILRPFFKAIYEPRTYVPPVEKRVDPLTSLRGGGLGRFISGLFWPFALLSADYRPIIRANGLDAFFFVRFLRLMVKILLPIWIISWAVLLPVTSVGIVKGDSNEQLNDTLSRFTFGNIRPDQRVRYWAQLACAWVFVFWILWNLKREMSLFIITRQQYLTQKVHSRSVQATTILVTGIPDAYLNHHRLRELFKELPGGVARIWINRNLKELPDIYDRRLALCNKLENAETTLLRTAGKLKLKAEKEQASGKGTAESEPITPVTPSKSGSSLALSSAHAVPDDQRPKHKTGFLGLWGEKVDTIIWCRSEIATCNELLKAGRLDILESDRAQGNFGSKDNILASSFIDENGIVRQTSRSKTFNESGKLSVNGVVKGVAGNVKGAPSKALNSVKDVGGKLVKGVTGGSKTGKYEPLNSAFIQFNKQISAHLAVQILTHHKPYRMSSRYVEVAPSDVIWGNLGLNPYEQKIRMAVSYAATAALVILWAFPVAFVGVVSNINKVCADVSWLAWICDLPPVVVGIISGILPPVLLAVLMMLLPIVLRLLARFEGIPKFTGLELSLMTRFFIFQVIHSFLIVTLSSGLIASLGELTNNPTSIPTVLAENLPKASTFFLTYIVLQGLAGSAGGFLQIVALIIYYVKLFILGGTPRSVYNIKYTPGSVAWGTLFPGITLLTVITLAYSVIAPIINGLAIVTFFLFYQLYKYLFLWVYQQDLRADTGGLFFPKAIQHVFIGLYIEEICLAALFFLGHSVPQGALMVVLIVITAGFHAILNHSYGPLLVALPLSLKDRLGQGVDVEEEGGSLGAIEAVENKDDFGGHASARGADANVDPESAISVEERERTRQGLVSEVQRSRSNSSGGSARAARKQVQAEENELNKYGFAHPAASRPQRTIWIPQDPLGLHRGEVKANRKAGLTASSSDAVLDAKGNVDVTGGPPGYAGL